ncbi:Tyrosine recombinase XerC [subsurface metagenome]
MAYLRPYYPQVKVPGSKKRKPSDKQDGWRLEWKDHNGRRRSKVFRGGRTSAEKHIQAIVIEIDKIKAGLVAPPERKMLLWGVIDRYLDYLEDIGRTESTVIRYRKSLKAFSDFLLHGTQLGEIKRRDVERFRVIRLKTCTEAGVGIDLRHLRAFFNWCLTMDYLSRSPMSGLKIPAGQKPVRFLTKDEINALFDAIGNDSKARDLVTFYLATGARATEILPPRFTWANVFQNEITLLGKGDKIRHIGLNDTLKSILESRKHLEYPFPYTYDGVYEMIVRKIYPLAGIQDANLHTLRKTAGVLLIQAGVDIYRVSKFLGHSSVTVTERHYVDLLREDYQEIARIMDGQLNNDALYMRSMQTKTD